MMPMDFDAAEKFTFEGDEHEAKVLSVYDGDTITASFPFGGKMYKWKCRLDGVDTPELRTSNAKEKEFGYSVRDKLREKILGTMVTLRCGDFDKYGRLLVNIVHQGEDVNRWLIDEGYAFAYDGGTKQEWFPESA
jgi:micrococcal nuclease